MASRKEQKEQLRAQRVAREQEEHAAARRKRLLQYGSGAAFLAVCAIAVLVVVSQSGGGASGAGAGGDVADTSLVDNQLKGIQQSGLVLGDPKSKVSVIEYGDLQCPVCKEFSFQVAPDLISQVVRKDQATYEFRPWSIIGPQSPIAAKAAYAAGEQGVGWNFIELFYRNQGEENSGYVTDSFLTSIAKGAGVKDLDKWNTDRKSSKWDSLVGQSVDTGKNATEAKGFGFTGTPSILVEGPGGKKPFTTIPTVPQIQAAIKSVQ